MLLLFPFTAIYLLIHFIIKPGELSSIDAINCSLSFRYHRTHVGEGHWPSHNLTGLRGYFGNENFQILQPIKCSIIATAWESR